MELGGVENGTKGGKKGVARVESVIFRVLLALPQLRNSCKFVCFAAWIVWAEVYTADRAGFRQGAGRGVGGTVVFLYSPDRSPLFHG